MDKHPIVDLMEASLAKIRQLVDVDTIIGKPIALNDVTVIPISRASFGFGAGGGETPPKENRAKGIFGGGGGGGVKIEPVAFIVVKDGDVNILPLECSGKVHEGIAGIIETAPGAIEKLVNIIKSLLPNKNDE